MKIADFGIASARALTEDKGVLKGKFGYMSPEQARGESVDRRSDLYALGVILWEILAGRPIHGGLGGEALLDIVRSAIVEPPTTHAEDIPTELEQIALTALSPAREDRYPTGREMAAAIGRAIVKQGELIDAGSLEAALAHLAPRAADSAPPSSQAHDSRERSDDARTQAAVPLARSMAEPRSSIRPESSQRPARSMDSRRPAAVRSRRAARGAARRGPHAAPPRPRSHGACRGAPSTTCAPCSTTSRSSAERAGRGRSTGPPAPSPV